MQFVPLVVDTYGRAQADFVRLMFVLAARQAEVIITHHRPDADFVQQRGVCLCEHQGPSWSCLRARHGDEGPLLHQERLPQILRT